MSTISLLRHLKETPEVSSANKLASQYRVAVTTVTRMLREAGYTYNGETWSQPSKSEDCPVRMTQEALDKVLAQNYSEQAVLDILQKFIEEKEYRKAVHACCSLYVLTNQPLPLVL